jgi:hypothetical protein
LLEIGEYGLDAFMDRVVRAEVGEIRLMCLATVAPLMSASRWIPAEC